MGHKQRRPGFLSGLMWGGLAGVAAGLMIAPRAGEQTRMMLREKSTELRGRAADTADQTRQRAAELQERSRALLEENRQRLTRTANAIRRSAREAWTAPTPEKAAAASFLADVGTAEPPAGAAGSGGHTQSTPQTDYGPSGMRGPGTYNSGPSRL